MDFKTCRDYAKNVKLEDIPGVGPKIAHRLVEHLKDSTLLEILCGHVSRVAEAVGSYRRALRIVRGAIAKIYGSKPEEFYGSKEAERIYEEYVDYVLRFVSSIPGRDKLLAYFFPLPSRSFNYIIDRFNRVMRIVSILLRLDDSTLEELSKALSKATWPSSVSVKVTRILVVPKGLKVSIPAEVKDFIKVVEVSTISEVLDMLREHDMLLSYGLPLTSLPLGLVEVGSLTPYELVPEIFIAKLQAYRSTLEAIIKAWRILGERLTEILSLLGFDGSLESIERLWELVNKYDGLDLASGVDGEYDRIRYALERIGEVVSDIEVWATSEVKRRLEQLKIEITAAELIRIFERVGEGVIEYPEEVYRVFEEVAEEAERKLVEELSLEEDEARIVSGIVPRTPRIPIELDTSKADELKELLSRKLVLKRYFIMVNDAKVVDKYLPILNQLPDTIALIDIALAFTRFMKAIGGSIPVIEEDKLGISFIDGADAKLLLADKSRVQRVAYTVGTTSLRINNVNDERVVILTGANSGGKTTLLRTIAEIAIAAHSSLPVPARKAHVGCIDKVYFYTKPPGMLGAGALEQALRDLAKALLSPYRKLVLIDEFEAITEAHAAAKIVAGLAYHMIRDPNTVGVIVTHLAREILNELKGLQGVRVDGIEARGLDENYNLIVDRQPRFYYLARSTPELVVQRLVKTSKDPKERTFFQKILELLEGV